MRIGFACDWKKDRVRTWSHSAISLFTALREFPNVDCVDLDLSLPNYQVYIYALLNAKIVHGTLKSKFRFSSVYSRRLEKNFLKKIHEFAPLDAIIEISDPAAVKDIPCYLYQDISLDFLIRYYLEYETPRPQYEMYSLDDLRRRREHQLRIYENSAGVFCMSRLFAESLVKDTGLDPKKVHLVHAGVNVKPVKVSTPPQDIGSGPTVLFVGRDFFLKAGDLVVEAFKLVRKDSFPTSTLVIAGPKQWPLKGQIPDGIVFLGDASWDLLQQYYSFADVFCMPSKAEGFGIVYVEALCYGIPCIARNGAVMSEIVQQGVNGYLLHTNDKYELAQLINKILHDPAMKARVRELSEHYRQYYSWNRVAADMVNIMKNRIDAESKRGL